MTSGRVKIHNGKVLISDEGKVATADDCCCGCPDECPCSAGEWSTMAGGGGECGGLKKCYQIKDYGDGDLSACVDCDNSSDTAWDGKFDAANGDHTCVWGPPASRKIDGKKLSGAATPSDGTHLWLCHPGWGSCSPPKWILEVCCTETGVGTHVIWKGEKTTGSTPVGTYTRTSGSDTTSSLEIEEATC